MVGKGFKSATLRFISEPNWGIPVTPDKISVLTEDGMDNDLEKLKTAGINAPYHDIDDVKTAAVVAAGTFGFEVRYQGMETLFLHVMGAVSTVEVASFTIDATNNKIDIKEDAGGEVTATVASSTYIMGDSDADSGSLCEAIKTALEAAGSGTYAVSFSNTTKKMTITVSVGASAVQMLPATGTNTAVATGPTIGYAADSASAGSIVADTAVVTIFDHTFTITEEVQEGAGLTLEKDADFAGFTNFGCKINTMELTQDPKDYLKCSMGYIAKDVSLGAVLTVDATNNKIDFKEDAGVERNGTIASGSYFIGKDSSVDGSLCKAIKTAMEAAASSTGTYTVTYSDTTKFINIAVSGLIAAVQVLWKTGTNGSDNADTDIGGLIGFVDTADSSNAASITGTVAIALATTGLTIPTAPLVCAPQVTVQYGISGSLATIIANKFSLSIDNKLQNDDYKVGAVLIAEPARTDKREVTGTMNLDFIDTANYNRFRDATSIGINAAYIGAVIKTGFTYQLTIDIGQAHLLKGLPLIEGPGKIKTELPFEAYAQDSSDLEFTAVLRNTLSAVA